jgi:hypothetical protein
MAAHNERRGPAAITHTLHANRHWQMQSRLRELPASPGRLRKGYGNYADLGA